MSLRVPSGGGTVRVQALALWLLLLSVLTHAVLPAPGSPLNRTQGSAFSAWTAEVSLAPKRKSLPGEEIGTAVRGGHGPDDPALAEPAVALAAIPAAAPFYAPRSPAAPAPAARTAGAGSAPFAARAPPVDLAS
jgi:hypothetical protein